MKKKEMSWDELLEEVKEKYPFDKANKIVLDLMGTCIKTVLKESKDDVEMGAILSMLASKILTSAIVTVKKGMGEDTKEESYEAIVELITSTVVENAINDADDFIEEIEKEVKGKTTSSSRVIN
jgi:hypothetical protein